MKPRPRILLWVHQLRDGLLEELVTQGIEIVALVQAEHPRVPSISIRDLFDGGPRLSAFAPRLAPAEWLDDANFRAYARCLPRLGFYPQNDTYETIAGGVVDAVDVEDWARLHLNHALQVLDGVQADAVWFLTPPHLAVDQMMALAAQRSGRTVLIARQLTIAPKFLFSLTVGNGESLSPDINCRSWTDGAINPNLFYLHEFCHRPWHDGASERLAFLLRAVRDLNIAGPMQRFYLASRNRQWWTCQALAELCDARTRPYAWSRWLARHRARRAAATQPTLDAAALPDKYVYFPLHLEPELNTAILGGDFANQLDAIVAMHELLAPGWILLLKENPKQGYMHRGAPYWRRLSQLSAVRFAAPNLESSRLIAGAQLIATITGTAGYESLLAGKPCLVFGAAWYAELPGVTRYAAGLNLLELAKQRVDRSALDAACDTMLSQCADGLVFPRNATIYEMRHDMAELDRLTAASLCAIYALSSSAQSEPIVDR